MRELLFKNMTSINKKRKVLCLSEVSRKDRILTKVNRRFIYLVKESAQSQKVSEAPEFYIFKNHDSKSKQEKFNLKIKGNFYVVCNQKVYLVSYCHSLRIGLSEQKPMISPDKS